MNTVMDDNKMLTLASNERIPLTPSMRLLLEINHMNHCSPATVSRGGVIFVNADDVGWKPVVDSWIERLEVGFLDVVHPGSVGLPVTHSIQPRCMLGCGCHTALAHPLAGLCAEKAARRPRRCPPRPLSTAPS
jgi:hypothetical protein